MELQTVSQVAKTFGISTRMLRYYEQVGLIESIRNDDNSYRHYDQD
ncbi:MAG: MerR family transcriptional regulator, partial [Oscillospiraceae bacterium]|nr:MerR family transcriptional regulator [Oscillospiraceae bacterium]